MQCKVTATMMRRMDRLGIARPSGLIPDTWVQSMPGTPDTLEVERLNVSEVLVNPATVRRTRDGYTFDTFDRAMGPDGTRFFYRHTVTIMED